VATTSFTVSVADQNGCAISSISSGLSVKMDSVPSITAVTVTTDNVFNGGTASLTFEVTPSIELINGDVFYVDFPSEITLPTSPSCTAVTTVKSTMTCSSPSSNKLKVTLQFTTSPNPSGTKFSFKVGSIKNAASTKPSSAFTNFIMQDSTGNDISTGSTSAPTLTNLSPAAATGTLSQYDTGVSVQTDYTITYKAVNAMPGGSSFYITYPSIVTGPSSVDPC